MILLYTREQIIEAIENCLNEREQQIINTRFGVYDRVTVPLDEIESMYGVTREESCLILRKLSVLIVRLCL